MSEASGHEEAVPAGCNNKHSDAGEQCIDEDDTLGLYNDIDDTFKSAKKMAHKAAHHFHETVFGDNDDSPDVAHNNVDVLGHWFGQDSRFEDLWDILMQLSYDFELS